MQTPSGSVVAHPGAQEAARDAGGARALGSVLPDVNRAQIRSEQARIRATDESHLRHDRRRHAASSPTVPVGAEHRASPRGSQTPPATGTWRWQRTVHARTRHAGVLAAADTAARHGSDAAEIVVTGTATQARATATVQPRRDQRETGALIGHDLTMPERQRISSTFNHGVDEWIACGLESFKPLS